MGRPRKTENKYLDYGGLYVKNISNISMNYEQCMAFMRGAMTRKTKRQERLKQQSTNH